MPSLNTVNTARDMVLVLYAVSATLCLQLCKKLGRSGVMQRACTIPLRVTYEPKRNTCASCSLAQ